MIKCTKGQQSHLIHNYVVPWVFSYVNDELIEEIVKHNCFFFSLFFPCGLQLVWREEKGLSLTCENWKNKHTFIFSA